MAKKKAKIPEKAANWMDTYTDMVTLLFCFFVLLYILQPQIDQQKWEYLASSFTRGVDKVRVASDANPDNDPTAIYTNDVPDQPDDGDLVSFDDLYLYLNQLITSNEELSRSASVDMGASGIYLRFRDSIFFEPDSYVLTLEGEMILTQISDLVRQIDDLIYAIKVHGHTAKSYGSATDEWALSGLRAVSVINLFERLDTVDEDKYSYQGFGGYRPIADNNTEEGRRQNRRVEIIFIRNDLDFSDPAVQKDLWEMENGRHAITQTDPEGVPVDNPNPTTPAPPSDDNNGFIPKPTG